VQLTLALLAIVLTPLLLAVFYAPFELITERARDQQSALLKAS